MISSFLGRLKFWVSSDSKIKTFLVQGLSLLGLYRPTLRLFNKLIRNLPRSNDHVTPVYLLNEYVISKEKWADRFETIERISKVQANPAVDAKIISGPPKLAVLVSLYRSDSYLSRFIENMQEQTSFHESEIFIVSVLPSPYEKTMLTDFSNKYENVKVDFHSQRTTIYEAWNLAIKMTSAPLITNANVDDLRSPRSFELQIQFAAQHPSISVFYQDVYLSMRPNCYWSTVEAVQARTNFPTLSLGVLLRGQNYPHNAPAWRRILHSELGYFDERYLSASDAEFWLRCALAEKLFMKMNDMHVAYFLNPEGVSTRPESTGAEEYREILTNYKKLRHSKAAEMKRLHPLAAQSTTQKIIKIIKMTRVEPKEKDY